MSPGSRVLALAAVATTTTLACGPEPANSVEVRQAVEELVDIGRAMTLEQTAVALSSALDPAAEPEALADRLFSELAASLPCAALSRVGAAGLRLDFGATGGDCNPGAPDLAGALRIVFSAPSPALRVATLTHLDLARAGSTLTGTTVITWGPEDTLRVVSELRLDSASARQIEIQADRVQSSGAGELRLDGWHRWQTLMGRWAMELGGWTLRPGALLPIEGVASIDTPFEHDIFVDFTGDAPGGLGVRANGGRSDHVFVIDAAGEIQDLGEP